MRLRRVSGKTGIALLAIVMLSVTPATGAPTTTESREGAVASDGTRREQHRFRVGAPGEIRASVDWARARADLTLVLMKKRPNGKWKVVARAATKDRPEVIVHPNASRGRWKAVVRAKSGTTRYTLSLSYPGTESSITPPGALASYSETFGFNGPAGNYAYGGDWDPSTNTILWGDYWNYRVKRYTIDGRKCTPDICNGSPTVVTTVRPMGQLGGSTAPYDIEVDMFDRDGAGRASFWVADQGASRIVQYTHNGKWLQTIGVGGGGTDAAHPGRKYSASCGNGNMMIPTHMWVDPGNGRLYVSDPRCRNVSVYTHTGQFLFDFNWAGWRSLTGLSTPVPRGLALGRDYNGDGQPDIYVVEHNSRRVVVFNKSGQYLGAFPRVDRMNDPRGLDVDPTTGRVVTVSAYRNLVFVFSPRGALLESWGDMDGPTSDAMGNRKFDSIRFPAVDGKGNIYVGDTWGFREPDPRTGTTWQGYRIYKFSPTFAPRPFATGPEPPPNGGLNQNNGVAVDPSGKLYVVDTFEQRVQKFDTSSHCRARGNCPAWMLQFGSREPAGPQSKGLGYPRELTFGDGRVWIGDNNNAVVVWTPNGEFVHRFGSQGKGVGQFLGGVQGVRVPGNGKVYTTDVGNCRLQIFDRNTALSQSFPTPIAAMGSCGTGPNQMSMPRGIEVSPDGSTVFVAETGSSRISRWNVSARTSTTVRPTCGGTPLQRPWGITWNPARTWLYIGDSGNRRVVRWSPSTGNCQVVTTGVDTPRGFKAPDYVAFGPDGRLFVSDNSRHVYAFRITG
jgi:DNA-binding beta-propeller fold protein YncE